MRLLAASPPPSSSRSCLRDSRPQPLAHQTVPFDDGDRPSTWNPTTCGVVVTYHRTSGPLAMSKPGPSRTLTLCASGATT